MEKLRSSSFKEYSEWYYQRELREDKIDKLPDYPVEEMKKTREKNRLRQILIGILFAWPRKNLKT